MSRVPASRLAQPPRLGYSLRSRIQGRHSSGSPSATSKPDNYFNKTGEREASDPAMINMRSDEYSKSGGDDIVAEQANASFKNSADTNPASEKEQAGRGNVVNPLEVSPASPEVSSVVEEKIVEKNVERDPNVRSGKGVTKKAKKVEKVEIDFSKIKMTRR